MGGFVGSDAERDAWVCPKVDKWAAGVKVLAGFATKHPQTAYAGVAMSLQAE